MYKMLFKIAVVVLATIISVGHYPMCFNCGDAESCIYFNPYDSQMVECAKLSYNPNTGLSQEYNQYLENLPGHFTRLKDYYTCVHIGIYDTVQIRSCFKGSSAMFGALKNAIPESLNMSASCFQSGCNKWFIPKSGTKSASAVAVNKSKVVKTQ